MRNLFLAAMLVCVGVLNACAQKASRAAEDVDLTKPMIEDYALDEAAGMARFYDRLHAAASASQPVRIGYFADSWIESDVLTVDLREKLQSRFGGWGIGWVDCTPGMYRGRPTIGLASTGISTHVVIKKPFDKSLQGISQRYFFPSEGATISLTAKNYREHASRWQRASLFFRSPAGFTLSAVQNGTDTTVSTMPVGSTQVQRFDFPAGESTSLKCAFSEVKPGTVLFGAALESANGVILDNLGVRSLQGYQLLDIPDTTLADFARLRPYDLIVLHFGVNAVTRNTTERSFGAYLDRMKRVIERFRNAYPGTTILVLSLSDSKMGAPSVNAMCARMQRQMAKDCAVPFFSVFDAMGGGGSIRRFVKNGWASTDHVHINHKGGEQVASYIFNAIMQGYNQRHGRSEKQ
ncbi:MAG: GDSL-type esterase/lipase family protein [Bacteroidales bacterium]|nr:GDSL-type esterase/lipase family protein [Bacteroidales bacterium]